MNGRWSDRRVSLVLCFNFRALKELGFAGKATEGWRWENEETLRVSVPTPTTPLNPAVAVVVAVAISSDIKNGKQLTKEDKIQQVV